MDSLFRNLNNFIVQNKSILAWATIIGCVAGTITLFLYFYDKWNGNEKTKIDTSIAVKKQNYPILQTKTDSLIVEEKQNSEDFTFCSEDYILDRENSEKYFAIANNLLEKTYQILSVKKMKSVNRRTFYTDTTTVYFTNFGIDIGVWQAPIIIHMKTLNIKQLKEYYNLNNDKELHVYFLTLSDTIDNYYPIIETEFRFNKEKQIGCISSTLYIKEGKGTKVDIKNSIINLDNSFNTWHTILKR